MRLAGDDVSHAVRRAVIKEKVDKPISRRQHLLNAVLKLFYLTGASLNICK